MTVVPGFIDCHNHAGGEVLLNEVLVGNPFEVEFVTIRSIVEQAESQGAADAAGHVGRRLLLRRHQAEGQPRAEHPGSGRGLQRPPGDRAPPRRAHVLLQQQGVRDGRRHQGHAQSEGRHLRQGRQRAISTDGSPISPSAAFSKVGTRPTLTAAQIEQRERDGLAHISKQFARYGLTSVHHEGGNLQAMQDVRARGELLHRISYETSGSALEAMIAAGIQSGFGDEWIRFGATSEHTVDGSFSERTMALSMPYPGVSPPYTGNVTETQETLNAWVERVHRAGIQVNCHANGDVAIDMYLTAAERAQKLFPRANARPKITHCTLVNADLVRRIKAIGAVPALFTTYAYYNPDKFVYYGEEMMKQLHGVSLAARCGRACGRPARISVRDRSTPLMGIQGMVTRKGWDGTVWGANQRISVSEAIAVNTYNGAWASGEEAMKGSITAGKLADFVVLANDPHTVEPETIKDIQIVRTVVGGTTSYQG